METVYKSDQKCLRCNSMFCNILESGPHRKVICNNCGKFIKFVKKDEYFEPVEYQNEDVNEPLLKDINFKLDLLLDHFNIKNKDE